MAIVRDLSGNNPKTDLTLTYTTRSVGSTPVGSIVPQFIGEYVRLTTNGAVYRAQGLTSADWVATNTVVDIA